MRTFRAFKKQDGFTLVEILVAVVVLLIIATAFVPIFRTSFVNIFTYGQRDKAMALASEKMEIFYARQPLDNNEIDKILEELSGNYISDLNNLYNYQNNDYNYTYEDTFMPVEGENNIIGYKITIVAFYISGDRYIELSSFVRKAD